MSLRAAFALVLQTALSKLILLGIKSDCAKMLYNALNGVNMNAKMLYNALNGVNMNVNSLRCSAWLFDGMKHG